MRTILNLALADVYCSPFQRPVPKESRVKTPLVVRVFSVVLLSLCVSPLASAQGVGAIGGTVLDTSGAVLPGVNVSLLNPGLIGGTQTTVTDERGTFLFTRLVPGRYNVKA